MNSKTFDEKQKKMVELFSACKSDDEKYQLIIQLGKKLPKLSDELKKTEYKVKGCQSTVYLYSFIENKKMHFCAESDSLMSAGLAALLINVYDNETPEVVLKNPPKYIDDLGLAANLTPNRANGLYSIHLKMKQDALDFYILSNQEIKENIA
ncbi:putative SufE-like protein YgdK [Candidatus Rubidus massiliensis]|nr:putative SufE-like protein YgdK [Candidatus Rubidus massiliensis]